MQYPSPYGLYHPRHEQDACGIGFVADIDGRKTHAILHQALSALENLSHRGAVSADGLSGDGAGVLTQIPYELYRRELRAQGIRLRQHSDLAVGMFFLPREDASRAQCIRIVEEAIAEADLGLLVWREVPVNEEVLGSKARATVPVIRQVLMHRPSRIDEDAYERLLFLTRKRIEHRVGAAGVGPFYIPSFSHRTLVYKGLMVPEQLDGFYPDLTDPDYRTAIALFHQRYSTNTFPIWPLAQPFRLLGHNGEINTLLGNRNWMQARERELESEVWGDTIHELLPLIDPQGSDSAMLDNAIELLVASGRDPLHVMMMLIPEAYHGHAEIDPDIVGFYEYHSCLVEPWDGPAAVVLSDGRFAAAGLDRNGLRPQRYWVTGHGTVIVASEAGVVPKPHEQIVRKGRLGPGQLLAVDTQEGRLLDDQTIKTEYARRQPYGAWVKRQMVQVPRLPMAADPPRPEDRHPGPRLDRSTRQMLFGYGKEDLDQILVPMLYEAREPVGSMGDDTPLAALSSKPQLLYRYFKQRFAQVTNPPIDPLRERLVMSLVTTAGRLGSLLEEEEEAAHLLEFESPLLSQSELRWIEEHEDPAFRSRRLDCRFSVALGPEGLDPAVERLCRDGERALEEGCCLLILSDRGCDEELAPIPMLLAVSALHHHLIRARKRMQVSLVCDTGEPREDHHFACLIGYGATLVHPYLAIESVAELAQADPRGTGISVETGLENYRAALEKGILKIMSKMGISPVLSYQGAQVFESIGIRQDLIDRYFVGTESRVGALGLKEIAQDVLRFHSQAFAHEGLLDHGAYRFRRDGEFHSLNPQVFKTLHRAVRTQSREAFKQYTELVEESGTPSNLRDLMTYEPLANPVPLAEVEPAEEIAWRFCTQAMSHGALSRETHEVLAIAMNRLGGKSNSGEGGEDRARFYHYSVDQPGLGDGAWHPKAGDFGNSAVKQIASGRFGVTPEYLVSAKELEIKMAQGSKPGEGGQIPGHKVSREIAEIRRAVPGVTLISPPPHHDIYSIEDLAQLIYDLKRVNRFARVCVKLVSGVGVGTIAAGVAKGYADSILISGHDGGTGASPLSSIKNAGLPWELGLAEAQQVLVRNDLRERVTLRVDGGLKTGHDVVMAALLGAEEFGFGTTTLIAAGCIMARQCHLNTCPVGVATQREELRKRFPGRPEHVLAFMMFMAEQVRMILAEMGARSLDEIIGRYDLLKARQDISYAKAPLDLSAILTDPDPTGRKARHRLWLRNDRPDDPGECLDDRVWRDCQKAMEKQKTHTAHYGITNRERSIGARLSGEIARITKDKGLPPGTLDLYFQGTAGQSFGLFANRGMRLTLEGEAQDYVAKGMYGGEIVLFPPRGSLFFSHNSVILGNTVLYGATGGSLYAAGRAGERLCVRNSGARAVVEGCGDHGCEYMTGGVVVILGPTGRNFGAGMSGGVAYVLDTDRSFRRRYNPGMVSLERIREQIDEDLPRSMIARHLALTGSQRAALLLDDWSAQVSRFWKVVPHPSLEERSEHDQDIYGVERTALAAVLEESQMHEDLALSQTEESVAW